MSAAHARRRPAAASSETAAPEAPDWSVPIHASSAYAEAIRALIGATLDEGSAMRVLDSAEAALGSTEEGEEAVGASWSGELDAGEEDAGSGPPSTRPSGRLGDVYDTHRRAADEMEVTLSRGQRTELQVFQRTWAEHRDRYEAVAAKTGVPAILVATIHYRESSMNFGTYLHQGDPLGRPAVNHPSNIPVFHDWEEAAIHALNLKKGVRDSLGMTEETTDPVAMGTYAEAYNGLGYHYRGLTSPYVYAGSDQYRGGRFVADGQFDPSSWDRRLGVLTIAQQVGESGEINAQGGAASGWRGVLSGDVALRQGSRGAGVEALQERLTAAGHPVAVDGQFGPGTRAAVVAFQTERGLEADGVVGLATAGALDADAPATVERSPRDAAWSTVTAGDELLKVGSDGAAVEALQERLRALGYGLRIDGRFGPITRAGVYDAQRSLGLRVDGVVGPATAAAIDRRLGR